MWEKQLGPDHPDVASNLNNMAMFTADADPAGGLEILTRTPGPNHVNVSFPWYGLGVIHHRQVAGSGS